MKKSAALCLLVPVILCVLCGVWSEQARAEGGKTPVVWPAADLKWTDSPGVKGAKIAVLWGDPKTGAYGALKKFSGGSALALHTHSHDQKVIVVAGAIVLTIEGGAPRELTAGSYAFIPAGAKHVAECKPGPDCVYFEEQAGFSDIKFVEEPGGKK